MPSSSQHAKVPFLSPPYPKTQRADLCRVWTELCMRESQARIRNQQLLQDFEGLEAQLAVLAAKTDALRRRKRDYEEYLQKLSGALPKHQGACRRQGPDSVKPPELLTKPLSAEWDGQLPLEMEYQSEPLPFPSFDTALTHAPGAHGRLEPGFGEYKHSTASLDHPFYSPTAHPARKHGGPALPSLWSPQKLQMDKKVWLFPGQGRSHSSSSEPWPVPGRTTVLGRGPRLPEDWLGPVMAKVSEGQDIESPTTSNSLQGKEARRHSILSREGSAEEHRDMAVRKEGHRLPCEPAGLSYPLGLHREGPSSMDESQLELPMMHSGNDSSGASVSSSAEVNSGHWVAERNTQRLPRSPRRKEKQQDADILNEEFAHMSWERFPGLLEHEGMAISQGSREVLREETLPCLEEQGNGELREKGGSEKEISADEGGEGTGSLDLGLEQTVEERRPLREGGAQEDEEIRGRIGGLEQGQENQNSGKVGEVSTAGEGNHLGCFDQSQEDLEEDSVEEKGQVNLGSERQEVESVAGKRNLHWSDGEGEKSINEVEGQSSEETSKPDRSEESHSGISGDKEGDVEGAEGSQEGPSCPRKKEDAASSSSSSDEVVIGPQMYVTSEQDNSGDCQTPSLQSEGPLATGAESTGEEEEEAEEEEEEEDDDDDDEEESEADTDLEAALAPHSNIPETTRDLQGDTMIPNLQEFEADSEEANKDRDLHDKDDFYD